MRREIILQALEDRNVAMGAFAAAVGTYIQTVSDICHDPNTSTSGPLAVRICAFLNLHMQDLFLDEINAVRSSLPRLDMIPFQRHKLSQQSFHREVLGAPMRTKDVSPAQMAALCGVSRTYISILLNSDRPVSLKMAIKFAAVLEITLDDIYRSDLDRAQARFRTIPS